MAIREIPLQPLPQQFRVTLGEKQLQMVTRWRDAPEAGWTLDICTSEGVPLIAGMMLVTGANLLAQYQHIVPGLLFVASDVHPWDAPTFENLGVGSHLYYDGDAS